MKAVQQGVLKIIPAVIGSAALFLMNKLSAGGGGAGGEEGQAEGGRCAGEGQRQQHDQDIPETPVFVRRRSPRKSVQQQQQQGEERGKRKELEGRRGKKIPRTVEAIAPDKQTDAWIHAYQKERGPFLLALLVLTVGCVFIFFTSSSSSSSKLLAFSRHANLKVSTMAAPSSPSLQPQREHEQEKKVEEPIDQEMEEIAKPSPVVPDSVAEGSEKESANEGASCVEAVEENHQKQEMEKEEEQESAPPPVSFGLEEQDNKTEKEDNENTEEKLVHKEPLWSAQLENVNAFSPSSASHQQQQQQQQQQQPKEVELSEGGATTIATAATTEDIPGKRRFPFGAPPVENGSSRGAGEDDYEAPAVPVDLHIPATPQREKATTAKDAEKRKRRKGKGDKEASSEKPVARPSIVLHVNEVLQQGKKMGNRCWDQGPEGWCSPATFLSIDARGRLELREGWDQQAVNKKGKGPQEEIFGRRKWAARKRLNMGNFIKAMKKGEASAQQGEAAYYSLKLSDTGMLVLLPPHGGEWEWRSGIEGAKDSKYEAFVNDEGKLVVYLGNRTHWKSF